MNKACRIWPERGSPWSTTRRQAPIPDDRRFSQAVHALVNDILEKEHAKQVSRYVINVPPYAWTDVDEPVLIGRKDDIARAASTAGDRRLVELLGAVEQAEPELEKPHPPRFYTSSLTSPRHFFA